MNTALQMHFTDTEIKKIEKSLVIITDTREQQNKHILEYFDKKKIPYKQKAMKTGDYAAMIPKNPELGIMRDIYLNAVIERKNSINELVSSIKDRQRFENELIRGSKHPFLLLIEDMDGYRKILMGDYRSEYKPKSLLASIKTFEARYNFTTVFIDPIFTGNYIYHHFLYRAKEALKG
ncbi:ERCC4 domain-containing protein [Cytobacillus sp. IB215665]|uniref:ERCC4 domain-containing protein n=1 Tax=Cytobacillus sp. IB215665 TaxID=3097357 RepID=UPI002A0BD91E|nr:ERCC4 domain-containing protein [Cytobacillus sp. IB215665]MDX8367765.1 ERCC4 domain-containing protein [Cytobacillus sp. IB215665]